MNLALTVLNITAPVFILAAIGFVWVRMGFEYRMQFVTSIAMTLSVPCLIFVALMRTNIDPKAIADLTLAALITYAVIAAAMFLPIVAGRMHLRTYLPPLTFGNTGNVGLPLALFAFGDVGLQYAVVVFAAMMILSFTIGIWIVAGADSGLRALKEPAVWATLLGALFLYQGWHTPEAITNTLQLIGQMAIPLMLITLGVAIARLEPQAILQAIVLSVIKIAVCVAAAWGASRWFALDPMAAAVLILQAATPVAVTSYMLAEKYSPNAQPVAGLVVASTLLSVFSLPLILSFVI